MLTDFDVLWITAGLSCDGDTISMTAATQPSLEDLVLGAIPGIPKLRLHNPVLAYQNGDEFMRRLHDAAAGKVSPFLLVVEGSISNEANKDAGVWAGFGIDDDGQPIPTTTWIDRLAPLAWGVVAAGTCAAYGGVPAMRAHEHQVAEGLGGRAAQLGQHEFHGGLANRQRAGEPRVLAAGPVTDRRGDHHARPPGGEPAGQRDRDVGVGGQRQVRPVLFGGADRDRQQRPRGGQAARFGPG